MKKLTFVFFLAVLGAALFQPAAPAADSATGTAPAPDKKPRVITVKQALTQPADFADERVLLGGFFRGYMGKCEGKRPVTKVDAMVEDRNGLCIFVSGPLPEGFDPDTGEGLNKELVLSGFVKKPKKGAPYFLVPATGKAVRKGPNPAAVLFQKQSRKKKIVPVEKLLGTPDMYVDKETTLAGIFVSNNGSCAAPGPTIAGASASWMMQAPDKRCLWVSGPVPESAKGAPDSGKAVVITGTLKKDSGKFLFIYAPAPK